MDANDKPLIALQKKCRIAGCLRRQAQDSSPIGNQKLKSSKVMELTCLSNHQTKGGLR